jgi:hypothetical protein
MRRVHAIAAIGLLAGFAAPALVSAQVTGMGGEPADVRRPYRGLFGAPATSQMRESLDLTGSLYGGYDDNVFARQGQALAPGLRQSGWYQGAQAGLMYAHRWRRVQFGSQGGVGVNRYPSQDQLFTSYQAAASIGAQVARYTQMSLSESFTYSPEFRLGLFPSAVDPGAFQDPFVIGGPDLGIFREPSYRTTTSAGLTQRLSDRENLYGYYSLLTANYPSSDFDYSNQGAGARYTRQLTQHAGLRLGYRYGTGGYRNIAALKRRGVHTIDAGVDYSRALSVSRRTNFSFSTGSALFYASDVQIAGREGLHYALTGSANLTHEMGRTWTASVAVRRSVDYHEGFADPFIAQSASATLAGMLSRRLSSSSSLSYSAGTIGVGAGRNFGSGVFTSGLQYAISRYLAAMVDYVYYRYRFDAAVAVDPRFPRSLSRNGVRVGLTTSIPLVRK